DFMQHALIAGLLTSCICGLMGSLAVVNRIVFLSGGIAHAAYGGIGLSIFMGWPFLVGTIGYSMASAVLMAAITLHNKERSDAIIGVIWASGMACGIILVDLTPGYQVDLMSYLFGSILTVPKIDLWLMAGVAVLITLFVCIFYADLLAISYDEEFARVRGVKVKTLYFSMIIMLAVSIVLMIQVVGLILIIALLTIPAYIMEKYAKSLFQMMIGASALGCIFSVMGLFLSYRFNVSAGASIILVASVFFLISGVTVNIFQKVS
ncbi:MAG: metal ABC transporter permease, partial [Candidatus Magnetomorum sp.]|nr:metal ABC transporter permease [Candidatus Magnetomorum sp.]